MFFFYKLIRYVSSTIYTFRFCVSNDRVAILFWNDDTKHQRYLWISLSTVWLDMANKRLCSIPWPCRLCFLPMLCNFSSASKSGDFKSNQLFVIWILSYWFFLLNHLFQFYPRNWLEFRISKQKYTNGYRRSQ